MEPRVLNLNFALIVEEKENDNRKGIPLCFSLRLFKHLFSFAAFPTISNNDAVRKLMDTKAVNIIHYGAMSQEHIRFSGTFVVSVFVVSVLLLFVNVVNSKGVFKHGTIKMQKLWWANIKI